jgi:hypothetical protein
MKGYLTKVLSGAFLAGGVLSAGCHHQSGEVSGHGDPCWPDRYANESRASVVASFQPQVENGHVLDQTIWNIHFDSGTDKLNGAGMDKVDQLTRRRPRPDTKLYLQTARDIAYDAEKPNDYSAKRNELDTKRTLAVQKYLGASLTGRPATFDIQVHDPSPPGIASATPGIVPAKASAAAGAASGGAAPAAAPASSGASPSSSGGSRP